MPLKSAFLSMRSRSSTDLDRASSWGVSAVGTSTVAPLCTIWQPRADVRPNKTIASRVFGVLIVSLLCHGHLQDNYDSPRGLRLARDENTVGNRHITESPDPPSSASIGKSR